jgi:hypothetical protein
MSKLTIRESIHGNFLYHLAMDGKALCGKKITIHTNLNIETWGMKTHLNEKYCIKCQEIKDSKGNF